MEPFVYSISNTEFNKSTTDKPETHQYLVVAYSADLEIVSYVYTGGWKIGIAALASELGNYSYSSYKSGGYLKGKRVTDKETLEQFATENDLIHNAFVIPSSYFKRKTTDSIYLVAFEHSAYLANH